MDTDTRICYDCPWKCINCLNNLECFDTCRGDRIFDDGSGVNCNCPYNTSDDGVSENCISNNFLSYILYYKNNI